MIYKYQIAKMFKMILNYGFVIKFYVHKFSLTNFIGEIAYISYQY